MERNDNGGFEPRPPYDQNNFGGGPPPPYSQHGFGANIPPYVQPYDQGVPAVKKLHTPSLVLSIIGLVFSLLFPLVTYPCSIIALVQSVKHGKTHKTTAALVMSVIALPIAVINSIAGAVMGAMGLHPLI